MAHPLVTNRSAQADKVIHKGRVPVTLRKRVTRLCPPGDLKKQKRPSKSHKRGREW